jgi:hypothetical protein
MDCTRALLFGMTAAAIGATGAAAADTSMLQGEAQKLGNGFAQLYVELDGAGAPAALGITFDGGFLEGLPTEPNDWSRCFDKNGNGQIDPHECHGDYELEFALPEELAGVTPFSWVSVNWNPIGHTPPAPPVWAAPHYDFHFYLMPREDVRAIRPGPCSELIDCDDFVRAQMPVPAQYVHADHIDVGAAVNDMGNHLIDSKSPELAPGGPPFTHTFIFGAYDGAITFYEPMITLDFLASRPDVCVPIKQPQAFAVEGHYPTTYCIRYVPQQQMFTVSLEDFVHRTGG